MIPSKKNDPISSRVGADDEIEFPLPDITNEGLGLTPLVRDALTTLPERDIIETKQPSRPTEKTSDHIFHIEVDKVFPNPNQPRRNFDQDALKELAESIREFGILQPLVVTKKEREIETGSTVEYELIAGERRLMAAKMLGLPTVPAIVRHTKTDVEKLELAVIENIQREDLNPIETGRAMARLQDEFGMTQREIATRLGKSREVVSNTMRLLNLPSEIQKAISEGKVGESQGRLLLSVEDQRIQDALFREVANRGMSVRDLTARIKRIKGQAYENKPGIKKMLDPESVALKEKLEELLGTRVDMRKDGQSGKIIINFYSQEELDDLTAKLFKQNDSQPTSHLSEI